MNKFTLDDEIVIASAQAISEVDENIPHELIINGGIANQLLAAEALPESYRPSHDIDFMIAPRVGSAEFRQVIGAPLAEKLNYANPQVGVSRHVYEVQVDDGEDLFLLHTYKWTKNGFARNKHNIERAISNAEYKHIPRTESEIKVARVEDLMDMKMRRVNKIKEKGKLPNKLSSLVKLVETRQFERLAEAYNPEWKKNIIKLKKQLPAMYDAGKDRFRHAADTYASEKDLYDLVVLAKLIDTNAVEYNETYHTEVLAA